MQVWALARKTGWGYPLLGMIFDLKRRNVG